MAQTYLPTIDYTARTYTTIKAALLDHVQKIFPNDWQDFQESNLGMCILELVAYVGDNLSFYADRQANEMFLPTAVQRQNIINLVKLIGYTPKTATAASTSIRARLGVAQTDPTIIDAYTTFMDKDGTIFELLENVEITAGVIDTVGQTVTWETLGTGDGTTYAFGATTAHGNIEAGTLQLRATIGAVLYTVTARSDGVIALPYGGTGLVTFSSGYMTLNFNPAHPPDNATAIQVSYLWDQNIVAYQGQTRLDQFSSTGFADQSFDLTNSQVLVSQIVPDSIVTPDPNRLEVWIGDPGAPYGNGTGVMWARVDTLVSATSTEQVYQVLIDDQDRVSILFGDGVNGAVPSAGTGNINVIYRTGGGLQGNIAIGWLDTNVTGVAGLTAVTVHLTNYDKGSGGGERESAEEVRVNAPAFLRTNDTATTESDYDTLASQYSNAAAGQVARAKSRLTPAVTFNTKVVHSGYLMGTVPAGTPLEYYLLLPATPAIVSTIRVYYSVGGIPRTVTATDLGAGLASLGGDATLDAANTRLRYDQQDYNLDNPAGFVGTGALTHFVGALTGFPAMPSSVLIHYTIGGTEYVGYDDGLGAIFGTFINGAISTINYATGAVDVTFTSAPDNVTLISFDYQSTLHLVLLSAPDAGTDITIDMDSGPTSKSLASNNVEVYTWAYDGDGNLIQPGDSLMDSLKSYLDLRRVLGISVQVLPGYNVPVNVWLTASYSAAVSSSETNDRLVSALTDYFNSLASVQPGEDVPLAGLYNAIFPLLGIDRIVIQKVGLRVPIGTGDAATAIFKSGTVPGTYISTGKLPAVSGLSQINVYRGTTLIGTSNASTPVAGLSGSGMIGGSYFNITTGAFDLRLNPAPGYRELVSLDFLLDAASSSDGFALWNTVIEPWEIAILGDVYVNGTKIN